MKIAAVNLIYTSDNRGDVLNFSESAIQTTAKVPDQITTFSQTSDYQSGTISLTWAAPAENGSPISSYTLMRDVGSGVYYTITEGLFDSYTDTGLVEGASYNYKVKANNTAGESAESSVLIGTAGQLPD